MISNFGLKIKFSDVGKYVAVHSSDVNALTYTYAALKGHGLREDDICKSFAHLVRRKICDTLDKKWPPTPDEFLSVLDEFKPLACIFNSISWSVNPQIAKDKNGYVKCASIEQAETIAAITECWERLITKKKTATASAMSLTLHRLTGSREATTLYHHAGMGISYTDVRCLTNTWGKSISLSHKKILPPGFKKHRSVHVTFDNSDGKQQTLTGDHTTHHTTGTIFQVRYAGEALDDDGELTSGNKRIPDEDNPEETDFRDYTIPKKRKSPKSFPEFTDKYSNSKLLEDSLYRDVAWALGILGILVRVVCWKSMNQYLLMK